MRTSFKRLSSLILVNIVASYQLPGQPYDYDARHGLDHGPPVRAMSGHHDGAYNACLMRLQSIRRYEASVIQSQSIFGPQYCCLGAYRRG